MTLLRTSLLLSLFLVSAVRAIADDPPARTDRLGDPLPENAVARLGTTRLWHHGGVHATAFSADGRALVTVGGDMYVRLWDIPSGRELRSFSFKEEENLIVAFSPDIRLFAEGDRDKPEIRLWEVRTGKLLRKLQGAPKDVIVMTFSRDGKTMALSHQNNSITLWDTESGALRQTLRGQNSSIALAFSPDGRTLASDSNPGKTGNLWDVTSGKLLCSWKTDGGEFGSLAFSPDGKVLAVGGQKGLRLCDPTSGKDLRPPQKQEGGVASVAFSPDGRLLAAACENHNVIRLWDVATGKVLWSARGPGGSGFLHCLNLAFSPDGKLLASPGARAALWEVATGKELGPTGHKHGVWDFVLSPDGKSLVVRDYYGLVRSWDIAAAKETGDFGATIPGVSRPAFGYGDARTLGWKDGDRIRLFDPLEGKELPSLRLGKDRFQVTPSPDGKLLAVVDGQVTQIRDRASGRLLRTFLSGKETLWSLFSPDCGMLLISSLDPATGIQALHIRDVEKGKEVCSLPGSATRAAFSPDGQRLALSCNDGTVRLWDLIDGRELLCFTGHKATFDPNFWPLGFSPDSRMLASSDLAGEGPLYVWEVASGKLRWHQHGHKGRMSRLVFSPDGRGIITGSDDTTCLVWDLFRSPKTERVGGPTPEDFKNWWDDLAGDDGVRAFDAVKALALHPKGSIPFLKEKLRPISPARSERVAQLLKDLGSQRFAVREEAFRDLETLDAQIMPALLKAMKDGPTLEARRRMELLRDKLVGAVPAGPRLRGLRAVEVLEHIGSPEAKELLRKLAEGAPEARITREAEGSLGRLEKRRD